VPLKKGEFKLNTTFPRCSHRSKVSL